MIWKLSDRVWWGDHECQHHPDMDRVRAILNVAHNLDDVGYRTSMFDPLVPYFRLALDDDSVLSDVYYKSLLRIIELVGENKWFPFLVHCRAGQHRSPNVAVVSECIFSYLPWEEVMANAKRLRGDIATDFAYSQSLICRFTYGRGKQACV